MKLFTVDRSFRSTLSLLTACLFSLTLVSPAFASTNGDQISVRRAAGGRAGSGADVDVTAESGVKADVETYRQASAYDSEYGRLLARKDVLGCREKGTDWRGISQLALAAGAIGLGLYGIHTSHDLAKRQIRVKEGFLGDAMDHRHGNLRLPPDFFGSGTAGGGMIGNLAIMGVLGMLGGSGGFGGFDASVGMRGSAGGGSADAQARVRVETGVDARARIGAPPLTNNPTPGAPLHGRGQCYHCVPIQSAHNGYSGYSNYNNGYNNNNGGYPSRYRNNYNNGYNGSNMPIPGSRP